MPLELVDTSKLKVIIYYDKRYVASIFRAKKRSYKSQNKFT